MDLLSYYKKVGEASATIKSKEVVIVSLATPEGGKEGVATEAPRNVAAKLIAEGRARLANAEESGDFRRKMREAREQIQKDEAARRLQVVVVPAKDRS